MSVIALLADEAIAKVPKAPSKNLGEPFKRADVDGEATASLSALLPASKDNFALLTLPVSLALLFTEGAIFKGPLDESG